MPLGSVLGAVVFLLYINELRSANLCGNVTSFADDTAQKYYKDSWKDVEKEVNAGLYVIMCYLASTKIYKKVKNLFSTSKTISLINV